MNCSWCTVLNPCNALRALWNCVVYCWRRLGGCWGRVPSSARAGNWISPTLLRLHVARGILQRYLGLEPSGEFPSPTESNSSGNDSPLNKTLGSEIPYSRLLSEKSSDAGSSSETSSKSDDSSAEVGSQSWCDKPLLPQTDSTSSAESRRKDDSSASNNVASPGDSRNDQRDKTRQEIPMVHQVESRRSQEPSSTSQKPPDQISASSEKKYGTF